MSLLLRRRPNLRALAIRDGNILQVANVVTCWFGDDMWRVDRTLGTVHQREMQFWVMLSSVIWITHPKIAVKRAFTNTCFFFFKIVAVTALFVSLFCEKHSFKRVLSQNLGKLYIL